jgi:hypothetical protein
VRATRSAAAAAVADFPAFVAAGIDTFDMGPETCAAPPHPRSSAA